MRISSLGIYGFQLPEEELWELTCEESGLTHPHPVCRQACALYTAAIAEAIRTGKQPEAIVEYVRQLAERNDVEVPLKQALEAAFSERPDTGRQAGWVLVAFQNAFYELIHTNSFEESVMNTAMLGGDTDTNAAIAGALLGAVFGRNAVPSRWQKAVLSCRPHPLTGARRPRPPRLWPVDLPNLAELLLLKGARASRPPKP
jgi:ADP-ribosylglycohydrolase